MSKGEMEPGADADAVSSLTPVANKTTTRPRQFETIVSFMEEHGDLAMLARAPSSYAQRRAAMDNWEQLGALLNAQAASGRLRSLEKWKKVWSDYKNNTKKKAQRLMQAARAVADDRPARTGTRARLTKLELRVLKIIGMVKQSSLTVPPLRSLAPLPEPMPELQLGTPLATLPEPPPLAPLTESPLRTAPLPRDVQDPMQASPSLSPQEQHCKLSLHSWCRQAPQDPLISPKHEPECQEIEVEVHRDLFCSSSKSEFPQPEETEDLMEEQEDLSRPASRGHTSTRGVRMRRRGPLLRLAAALQRAEASRRRAHAHDARLQRGWQRICERGLALLERFLDNQNAIRHSTSSETPQRQDTEEAPDNSEGPGEPSQDVLSLSEGREQMEPHRPLVFHPERLL